MNTSIEDQASQSTCDQRSESSSSAHLQSSPLRSSSSTLNSSQANNYNLTTNNNNNNNNNIISRQQQQQAPPSMKLPEAAAAAIYANNPETYNHAASRIQPAQQYDLRSLAAAVQQSPAAQAGQQQRHQYATPPKRAYSGVDKLIMAAMIDDAQAVAASPASGGVAAPPPSGRGLGYFAGQRGGFAQIPTPSSRSEYELYRLLERANLLNYFGTFLNFGGDDVQQLCDADEDEFLEIMSLVGMTQKPLHVRRLQKALIEWRETRDFEISMLRSTQLNLFINQPQSHAKHDPMSSSGPPPPPPQAVAHHPIESSPSMRLTQVPPVSTTTTTTVETNQSQYIAPRDLLIGAPKRIRLLDSLTNKQSPESGRPEFIRTRPDENQSPLKRRLGSTYCSSPKRDGEVHSDEEVSEDESEIEVMDNSHTEAESENENDAPKSRKLTRADYGTPTAARNKKSRDDYHHPNATGPSKRSQSDMADPTGRPADDNPTAD